MTSDVSNLEHKIGELLVGVGFITQAQLDEALAIVNETGRPLREVLVGNRSMADETFATYLSLQLRVPIVDLRKISIEPNILERVPIETARRYRVLPLGVDGGVLRVAMDDPMDPEALKALEDTGYIIRPRLPTREGDVLWYIELLHPEGQYFHSGIPPPAPESPEEIHETPHKRTPYASESPEEIHETPDTTMYLEPFFELLRQGYEHLGRRRA